MKNIYLIKDLASISGQSIHTIKYYIKLGLVHAFGRSPTTRFRFFGDEALLRLQKIRELRKRSLSLKDIKERMGS
ncbi:MerR family transcriptional regulator [PVC group bacterium]|nr:MerR family transcriptional regulator [PVC group bacterium]